MTALAKEIPDKVPVFLRDLTLGLDLLNLTTPEVCCNGKAGGYDAEKSAEAIIACWNRFGHDCVVGSIHDLGLDVETLGGRTDFPMRGVPRVIEAPFENKTRLASAKVPLMDRDGRLPGVLKSYDLVKQRIGAIVAIAANIEGPVTKAAIYRGTQNLMTDLLKDPGFAVDLVAFSTDVIISHIKQLAETGVDFIFIAAATDGPVIISSDIYLSYTIPNLERIVSASANLGLKVVFHPHGKFTEDRFQPLVDAAIGTGIAGFQFPEDCDIGIAKHLWGDRIAILGGVDITSILIPGPPKKVWDETKKNIDKAAKGGGYLFMPTCSIHRGYPINHIETMVKAVREFGNY